MNISTLAVHMQLNSSINRIQRSLFDAQKEMSSGRKADVMAMVEGGAREPVDLRTMLTETEEYQSTATLTASRLETMQRVMGSVNEVVTNARTQALTGRDAVSRRYLEDMAGGAIAQVTSLLNTQLAGRSLFAGIRLDTKPLQEANTVNAASGFSPMQAIQQVIAANGPITDAASALNVVSGADGLDAIFGDSHSNGNLNFSSTFYNGATTGTVTARLDHGYDLDYGVRADNQAFRQVLEGVYMLASVPYGSVPDDAFAAWQDEAVTRINAGFQGIIDTAGDLGFKQQIVQEAADRHEASRGFLNNRVANLEAADPYETAIKFSQLQTQLESSFAITTRLANLTLTKFL
jgi:flagellar hook-associated protein 3 FlgL